MTLDATVMEGHAENMGGSEALGKVQNNKSKEIYLVHYGQAVGSLCL